MSVMASLITGVSIVYSAVCSGTDQRKHQNSVLLVFVRGIHRWLVNSPHKGPVTRKMFPFDDVIMASQKSRQIEFQIYWIFYCSSCWSVSPKHDQSWSKGAVHPKNFHDSSDICPMGFIYSIQICEIFHRTFGPSHQKCPMCPMIFMNTEGVSKAIISMAKDIPWWCHQMETFSVLLAIFAGNSPVTGQFPTQRPVTRSFDVFFDLRWRNGFVNNREAGDLRRHRAQLDVIVMHPLSECSLHYPAPSVWASLCYPMMYRFLCFTPWPPCSSWTHGAEGVCYKNGMQCISRYWEALVLCSALTHWSRDKMAAFSQTTLSNAFSWMKILEFRLKFHWSLFLRVQLTIFQHWFR